MRNKTQTRTEEKTMTPYSNTQLDKGILLTVLDSVSIRRTENGGWYAYNYTRKEDTRHYVRKTENGAKSHARKLWGAKIKFVG